MRLIDIGGIELEVRDTGTGEPVVLVQTALTADELVPLADGLVTGGFRTIVYHRRGYAGSGPVQGRGSVVLDAADCRDLVGVLGLGPVNIVGYSYSGAVGLQLAADAPEQVHTLTLIEPPPVHVPASAEFREANDRLLTARREHGPGPALEEFLSLVIGSDWHTEVERRLPGATAQMRQDRTTFFDTDLPALLSWKFDADDARRVTCPVLHVAAGESGPWFAQVRDLILEWLPHAEDVVIDGADHSLALTHATEISDVLIEFLRRNPVPTTERGG